MQIDGQEYVLVSEKKFTVRGEERTELTLRKPNGRRLHYVVVYANGTVSSVVVAA